MSELSRIVQNIERRIEVQDAATAEPCLFSDLPPVSETRIEEAVRWAAVDVLNRAGARQFHLDDCYTIGLWTAADTPEVRAAIGVLHPRGVPVLHLEDVRVPDRYRQCKPVHLGSAAAEVRVLPGTPAGR